MTGCASVMRWRARSRSPATPRTAAYAKSVKNSLAYVTQLTPINYVKTIISHRSSVALRRNWPVAEADRPLL